VLITGFWGYRRRYDSQGWLAVDALSAAILTAGATTFTVADADGADTYGVTPRFSIGSLVRIEDEMMEVTGISTNTLTVIRGYRGSTAAAHANGTAVKVWNIEPEIRHVAARQVGLIYARRGAYEQTVTTEFATISYPADFVTEVRAVVQRLMYA
jgi:hypothetical protein